MIFPQIRNLSRISRICKDHDMVIHLRLSMEPRCNGRMKSFSKVYVTWILAALQIETKIYELYFCDSNVTIHVEVLKPGETQSIFIYTETNSTRCIIISMFITLSIQFYVFLLMKLCRSVRLTFCCFKAAEVFFLS